MLYCCISLYILAMHIIYMYIICIYMYCITCIILSLLSHIIWYTNSNFYFCNHVCCTRYTYIHTYMCNTFVVSLQSYEDCGVLCYMYAWCCERIFSPINKSTTSDTHYMCTYMYVEPSAKDYSCVRLHPGTRPRIKSHQEDK